MYYSNGNYEAFARPEKPENVDQKSAYLIGAGIASLSAAAFLVRDGQMKGENIHILEEMKLSGGACDGIRDPQKGFIIRGGREMENHYECLWDLYRSIPSLETEGISVLDEFYRLNKKDPNASLMRVTVNRGEHAGLEGFNFSAKALQEVSSLFLTRDEALYDKKISDVLSEEFFSSNFWLYWRTMFAFEEWHSALEMKLYLQRFIHHIGGLSDFSSLKFTKYNQYESLILPVVKYLESHGVNFVYDTVVTNVVFDIAENRKVATKIQCRQNGDVKTINLTENDLVFITNGSCTENSALGDNDHAPVLKNSAGGSWDLWRNIAKQSPAFGNPEKFCAHTKETNWESATVTLLDDKIPKRIQDICKRDPYSGKVVTGGIITVKDSNWLMSYTMNRQPHFKDQPKNQLVVWLYGLFGDTPGNYIKKPMKECTGTEIVEEWLYHMGVAESEIHDLAKNSANCIPCVMPYVTSFFMPRTKGDRPKVVPDGSVNFAFIGQFSDTARDTVFTVEYSARTAMEAVYTLLNVDRGVPEVFGSCFDIRVLLQAASKMMDGRKLPIDQKMLGAVSGTIVEDLLKQYSII
ncbi:oleate hydratase [Paraburkholderia haematera]|uniref:Oleate hydratase n=1 Tax=Paraburkholderia haematera TaxID=2793077 RepID=A0ABN7KNB1_9BURK|nr:oleate hydratase [Paraburkholderia haematera]CAE6702216.1 Oleate hydratase [Paraburkholderia haematera]